jgi:hypothetical protein
MSRRLARAPVGSVTDTEMHEATAADSQSAIRLSDAEPALPMDTSNVLDADDPDSTGKTLVFWSHYRLRYADVTTENRFLCFCHSNVYPRVLFVLVLQPFRIGMQVARAIYGDHEMAWLQDPLLMLLFVGLPLLTMVAVLFTIPAIVQRLPACISFRMTPVKQAILAEYLVTLVAVISRISDMNPTRLMRTRETPHGTIHVGLVQENFGVLIWYMAFAPPRIITAFFGFVVILAVHAMNMRHQNLLDATDACGASLIPLELLEAAAMLVAWESWRRANFEARMALKRQAQRGSLLVRTLQLELQDCRSKATLPGPVTVSSAVVIVVRTSGLSMALKKRVIDVSEKLLSRVGPHSRFACSGDTVCAAFGLTTADGAAFHDWTVPACAFARVLMRHFADNFTDDDATVQLRVGIDCGSLSATPSSDNSELIVSGHALQAALRLSELALAGSTLVSDRVHDAASAAYTLTRLLSLVLEGQRSDLYLLGMACRGEAHAVERRLRLTLGANEDACGDDSLRTDSESSALVAGPGFSTRQHPSAQPQAQTESHGDDPSYLHKRSDGFAQLIEADATPIAFYWHWLWGWLFADTEAEAEFRGQECHGFARYMPAIAAVLMCFVALGWFLSAGLAPMTPAAWGTWAGALFAAIAMCVVARPYRLGQRRLLVLHALMRVVVGLLGATMLLNDDYANPMRMYLVNLMTMVTMLSISWLPSCLPIVLVSIADLSWLIYFAAEAHGTIRVALPVAGVINGFFIAQTLRARNRSLFADRIAARRSAERWSTARLQLQHEFSRVIPASVASRIVATGTASAYGRRVSGGAAVTQRCDHDKWIDYTLHSDLAVAMAIAIETPPGAHSRDDDDAANYHLLFHTHLQRVCEETGLFLRSLGATWLVVDVNCAQTVADRWSQLQGIAADLKMSTELLPCTVKFGIAAGAVEGTLCGTAHRRYEVMGPAIVNALLIMDEGSRHPPTPSTTSSPRPDTDSGGCGRTPSCTLNLTLEPCCSDVSFECKTAGGLTGFRPLHEGTR